MYKGVKSSTVLFISFSQRVSPFRVNKRGTSLVAQFPAKSCIIVNGKWAMNNVDPLDLELRIERKEWLVK